MPEKNVLNGMKVKVSRISANRHVPSQDAKPTSFHRCPCTRCGKDSLHLRGFGELDQSPLMGVTSEGVPGLAYYLLDRDYLQGITCQECGYDVSLKGSEQSNALLKWARSHGEEIPALGFTCHACGTHKLFRVELQVEIHSGIAAVCEIVADAMSNKKPLVTVTGERLVLGGSPYRFRCENDHELAKDDGKPVETAEELVALLKALSAHVRG